MTTDLVTLLVMDHDRNYFGEAIDEWDAIAVLAATSDDPSDWNDVRLLWPRYRSNLSAEFADAARMEETDLDEALQKLEDTGFDWLVVDLTQKQLFCAGRFAKFEPPVYYGDENDSTIDIPIVTPPWWKIHKNANVEQIRQPREEAPDVPLPRRDVLWGRPWLESIAERMMTAARSAKWSDLEAKTNDHARYRMTVAIHRDWLMTEREDLGGLPPRHFLHNGRAWIDSLVDARRFGKCNNAMVPLDPESTMYERSPLGTIEVVMYFEACRAVIEKGWEWILDHRSLVKKYQGTNQLVEVLEMQRDAWLQTPGEDPETPADCIDSERQRIPLVSKGSMDPDCDCPICLTMGESSFGPSYIMFDGYHLELDEEFAFSLHGEYLYWEEEQADASDDSDGGVTTKTPAAVSMVATNAKGPEELESAWETSYVDWETVQGTPMEHMALSFLLADMVNALQQKQKKHPDIRRLNEAFADYRGVFVADPGKATRRFQTVLDEVASQHTELVSRIADFESKLDEICRRATLTP